MLAEHADPLIIFQTVHRVCPEKLPAELEAFIPLHLAEKEKPFQSLGITKSCHVVDILLPDSSGSLQYRHTCLILHSRRSKDPFLASSQIQSITILDRLKPQLQLDTLFFLFKPDTDDTNLPKL